VSIAQVIELETRIEAMSYFKVQEEHAKFKRSRSGVVTSMLNALFVGKETKGARNQCLLSYCLKKTLIGRM
jgi:hypothetical protein